MSRDVVKQELLAKLKQEHCFWSYNENLIKDIPDDMLIEKTLLHLDLEEINQLFLIYPFKKIKQVWLDYLVPQAEYLYTLNRFFAWYYFKAKKQAESMADVKDIRKVLNNNTIAEFGYNEPTNRITIKIKDKDTDEVIKEIPSEKALEMLAKAWELAGIMVDERR